MTDWNDVKCYQCKYKCNSKGNPSITKGSPYCKDKRGLFTIDKKEEHIKRLSFLKRWFKRG